MMIEPDRIDIELTLSLWGEVWFVPDLTIYGYHGMKLFAEVVHKSHITPYKLGKMLYWSYKHKFSPTIIEVDAIWIMKQIAVPDVLKYDLIHF